MLKFLSKIDCLALLEYVESTSSCDSESDLLEHVLGLSCLFGFEKVVCAYSPLVDYMSSNMHYDFFATNLPDDYLRIYMENDYHLTDPVVTEYFEKLDIIHWKTLTDNLFDDKNDAIDLSEQFGLHDGFTYGIFDRKEDKHTVFLWGGETIEKNDRTISIIRYITPFLSELIRKICHRNQRKSICLTPKEVDVLNWLKEGKSSWEISVIQNISERTVNFHIHNIKTKLNASNRTHSVAIAMEQGLIQL